jgi:hypothetical protein
VLKNPENIKNQGNIQVWIVKENNVEEKEVEEVKMLLR